MNRKKMIQQAQVLRRKRMARAVNVKPRLKDGIIKLDKPISNPANVPIAVNGAEIRRKKAEQLLKQRQESLQKRQTPEQKSAAAAKAVERQRARRNAGCGGCRRRRGQG